MQSVLALLYLAVTAPLFGAVVWGSAMAATTAMRPVAARSPELLIRFARIESGMAIAAWGPADDATAEALRRTVGEDGSVFALGRAAPVESPELDAFLERGKLDAALLLYDVHELIADEAQFAAVHRWLYRALRPGGYYVVVDSQAGADMDAAEARALGRVDASMVESKVVDLGFERLGRGRFLANPDDQYQSSVLVADARATADRFVLRFRKPLPPRPAPTSGAW